MYDLRRSIYKSETFLISLIGSIINNPVSPPRLPELREARGLLLQLVSSGPPLEGRTNRRCFLYGILSDIVDPTVKMFPSSAVGRCGENSEYFPDKTAACLLPRRNGFFQQWKPLNTSPCYIYTGVCWFFILYNYATMSEV